MVLVPVSPQDPHRFVNYYASQVGHGLPGFAGTPVMRGRGLGSMFARLFKFGVPFVRCGFEVAKLHLKSAAKHIASDIITTAKSSKRHFV